MKNKPGRNDPCWCGSGRKFKKCHDGRDRAAPPNPFEVDANLRKAFSKKLCLHPQASPEACKGRIVRAHTIQKAGGLSRIAEKGHVYRFKATLQTLLENQGLPIEVLVGIKQASTFSGFCAFHDSTTFEPIEQHPFLPRPHPVFLLGYRALCRELFAKKAAMESKDEHRNLGKGKPYDVQRHIQRMIDVYNQGIESSLRQLNVHKQRYDRTLMQKNFDEIRYYVLELTRPPEIMATFGFYPEYDFKGNRLQNIAHLDTPLAWKIHDSGQKKSHRGSKLC